jgi:hypothetical protein
MTRKLYALSGIFLIALVIAGLSASKAGGFTEVAQATDPFTTRTINGLSMEEMTRGAELIVIGKCTGTKSEWIDGRRLVTLATVSVTETIKGAAPESVIVEVPGGRGSKGKFQLATTYPGAPTIAPDEEMALFLVPANDGVANGYSVMGFNAGKFSIVKDVDDRPIVTSVPMKVRAPRATGLTSGNSHVIELSEFKALLEGYLR